MNTGDSGDVLGQVQRKINNYDFNEVSQINAVKNEPREIDMYHKHAADSYGYEDHIEEKFDVKNLDLKDFDHSKIFENSTSTFTTVGIKKEDIDIFYEDIKHETGEEKSSESIRFCEVCYQSFAKEIDFLKPTSYRSNCTCPKQNKSPCYNKSDDMTLDVKPSNFDIITDLGLQSFEVQDQTISGDKVTKEPDSSAAHQRLSIPPMENYNKNNCKFCSQHAGANSFQCKICSNSSSRIACLKVHEKVNAGEKPFHCKVCSKFFSRKSLLKVHERGHTGEKPFNCKMCSKSFSDRGILRVHERIHTGEKPFQCKICSKSYSRTSHLKVHERGHTGEKPFNCKICSKSFSDRAILKVHQRVHTGEKPFNCKICSKSFSQSSTFKIHERVHTGEKPFHCKICSKAFSNSSHWRAHERIHTEKILLFCKICSKSFSRSSNLKRHERVH